MDKESRNVKKSSDKESKLRATCVEQTINKLLLIWRKTKLLVTSVCSQVPSVF